jgi:hypothetical protein
MKEPALLSMDKREWVNDYISWNASMIVIIRNRLWHGLNLISNHRLKLVFITQWLENNRNSWLAKTKGTIPEFNVMPKKKKQLHLGERVRGRTHNAMLDINLTPNYSISCHYHYFISLFKILKCLSRRI